MYIFKKVTKQRWTECGKKGVNVEKDMMIDNLSSTAFNSPLLDIYLSLENWLKKGLVWFVFCSFALQLCCSVEFAALVTCYDTHGMNRGDATPFS